MQFDCKVGDTAIFLDEGGGHRYVILTNANKDGLVVRVNITSSGGRVDGGRVFYPSDDRYIFEYPSVVPYQRAQLYPADVLRDEEKRADIVHKYRPCRQDIMDKIIEDAFKSQFTIGDVIEELRITYPKAYDLYY